MNFIGKARESFKHVSEDFTVEVLARDLQPVILETLRKHGKDRQRKSVLSPLLTVWLTLGLPLRRELSYHGVLDWLVSGLRSLGWNLPRRSVKDGAITHARKRMGVAVFLDLFKASAEIAGKVRADFHGMVSVAVDGTTMTMPDTKLNLLEFGKPRSGRGVAAFPQVRLVGLVATSVQALVGVAAGPCCGKGTGERTLGMKLILENARQGFLFLLDRGFYGFDLLHAIFEKGAHWIVRVPKSVKLEPIRKSRLPDGSYFAWLIGKVEDPAGPDARGRKRWIKVKHKVRVVRYQIKGFRSTRLATSLLDSAIEAKELVREYHRRWEIELAYDSVKTHQCGTRTGQCPTVLRSKRPDLVRQEIYAMLTIYNLIRALIQEAAVRHGLDPLSISFVHTLCTVIDAIPGMRRAPAQRLKDLYQQLLEDIARGVMTRRRRPRSYPRVVKIKMSKFKLKRLRHKEIHRNFLSETRILGEAG